MAPTATDRDGFAPSSRICFGDLGFVATDGGELRLDPATAPAQVLTFGSLDFVIDRLGNLLDYIADRVGDLDIGDRAPALSQAAIEQPVFESGALSHFRDVTTDS